MFDDANKIVEAGSVKIGENHVPVEMFLGGDYKVIIVLRFEYECSL